LANGGSTIGGKSDAGSRSTKQGCRVEGVTQGNPKLPTCSQRYYPLEGRSTLPTTQQELERERNRIAQAFGRVEIDNNNVNRVLHEPWDAIIPITHPSPMAAIIAGARRIFVKDGFYDDRPFGPVAVYTPLVIVGGPGKPQWQFDTLTLGQDFGPPVTLANYCHFERLIIGEINSADSVISFSVASNHVFENVDFFTAHSGPILDINSASRIFFNGCRWNSQTTKVGPYVDAEAGSNLIYFVNCRIQRIPNVDGNSFISVRTGSNRIYFNGTSLGQGSSHPTTTKVHLVSVELGCSDIHVYNTDLNHSGYLYSLINVITVASDPIKTLVVDGVYGDGLYRTGIHYVDSALGGVDPILQDLIVRNDFACVRPIDINIQGSAASIQLMGIWARNCTPRTEATWGNPQIDVILDANGSVFLMNVIEVRPQEPGIRVVVNSPAISTFLTSDTDYRDGHLKLIGIAGDPATTIAMVNIDNSEFGRFNLADYCIEIAGEDVKHVAGSNLKMHDLAAMGIAQVMLRNSGGGTITFTIFSGITAECLCTDPLQGIFEFSGAGLTALIDGLVWSNSGGGGAANVAYTLGNTLP